MVNIVLGSHLPSKLQKILDIFHPLDVALLSLFEKILWILLEYSEFFIRLIHIGIILFVIFRVIWPRISNFIHDTKTERPNLDALLQTKTTTSLNHSKASLLCIAGTVIIFYLLDLFGII